jgi:hypothetical protein
MIDVVAVVSDFFMNIFWVFGTGLRRVLHKLKYSSVAWILHWFEDHAWSMVRGLDCSQEAQLVSW